jgi:hypothetical protein
VPIARLEEEIARCEVVCVNCHRRRTARRAGWGRLAPAGKACRSERWRRNRNIEWVYARLRAASCVDCGIVDIAVLEFDHVGEKRGGVMDLAWAEYSLDTLAQEIEACEVRCCNCHRRKTATAASWFRLDAEMAGGAR